MDQIELVRDFNRYYTRRLGILGDRYLGQGRPLSEARLLFEIGPGADLRSLRARLGLDSGYLSRLLRSLETTGLVTVRASDGDRRIRVARLTAAGRAERVALDQRADEHARSLLARLSSPQRERLVAAMRDVERLLTSSSVEITPVDPEHRDARYCLAEYVAELNRERVRYRSNGYVFTYPIVSPNGSRDPFYIKIDKHFGASDHVSHRKTRAGAMQAVELHPHV